MIYKTEVNTQATKLQPKMYNILICNRLADERKSLLKLCRNLDCEVNLSVNINETIQKILTDRYNLLFLDLDSNGREALRAVPSIKKIFPNLPILLAGNGMLKEAKKFHYENVFYFEKPLNLVTLFEFLDSCAKQEQ